MTQIESLVRSYLGGLAHVHTRLSNYRGHFESDQTIGSLVDFLREHGMIGRQDSPFGYLMITEHASNPTRPRRLGKFSWRARALRRSQWANHRDGVPVLHGFEASLLPEGGTDLTPWLAEHSRLVIASAHRLPQPVQLASNYRAELLENACASPDVDVLGHAMRGLDRPGEVDWRRVFGTASASGTAVEVNLNIFPSKQADPERFDFWQGWLKLLADSGAGVFIGSDIHNRLQLKRLAKTWRELGDFDRPNTLRDAVGALDAAGIGPERVVNARYSSFTEWLNLPKEERR